eukprot:g4135.t1
MLLNCWDEVLACRGGEIAVWHPARPDGLTFMEIESRAGKLDVEGECVRCVGGSVDFFASLVAAWRVGKPVLLLENEGSRVRPIEGGIPEGTYLVKQTCGSSGVERSLFFGEKEVFAEGMRNVDGLGLEEGRRGVAAISLAHSYGFGCLALPLILRGIPLDVVPGPMPMFMQPVLDRGGEVFLPGVPAIWKTWWQTGVAAHPAIKLAITAGSPFSVKLEQSIHGDTGLKVRNFYGTSETGAIAFDRTDGPRTESGLVGEALRGVSVFPGKAGRLAVVSDAMATGSDMPREDEFCAESYLTMDQGRIEGGQVYVTRCIGKAINVAGRKVSPRRLRGILEGIDGVRFASVECEKSRDYERYEEILARVRLAAGVDGKRIREEMRGKVESWEMPRRWEFESENAAFDLNEISHAAFDGSLDGEGGAGRGGAEDFRVFYRGEFEAGEDRFRGIRLGDDAAELGDGLDHDDARPDGFVREVPLEEFFFAADPVGGGSFHAVLEGEHFPDEAEFGAVRKESHMRLGQRVLSSSLGRFVCVLELVGVLRVYDRDLVEKCDIQGPMIIACNHPALWDAPIVLRRFPQLSGIMKSEVLANPFLSIGARFAGFLPNSPRLKMVKMALARLKGGGRLLLFPEGTRTREENGLLNPFRPGLALLAERSGVPVLPVFISSNSRYLQKGWPIWKMPELPISVTVRVGEPLVIGAEESVRDFSTRLEGVFREAEVLAVWDDVFVVIDGSTDGSADGLEDVAVGTGGNLRVHRLEVNQGKGAAILEGISLAGAEGFTHALAMDADGQHPASHVEKFMEMGRKYPEALVLGEPVFDEFAPALRVNGRKVSNWWANLETLWWGIHDSLFGMRLYPIEPLKEVFSRTGFARRFDFDPEVAVRLCWAGVPVVNLKTPVKTDPLYGGVYAELKDSALPLLDIGCGMGVLAMYLRERGWMNEVRGIDYDASKIVDGKRVLERGGYAEISITDGDARVDLPDFKGNVTILDILQFFSEEEQVKLLKLAAGRVAPGGKLVIRSGIRDGSVRFYTTLAADFFAKLSFWMKSAPVCYPGEELFREELGKEGFDVEIRPLWGKTPFNNFLIVAERPEF